MGPANVVLIVNLDSPESKEIAAYYAAKRAIPHENVCSIRTSPAEGISRETYQSQISKPVADCLRSKKLVESTYYLVTTLGVPLKIGGNGSGFQNDGASVDSELTLLYQDIRGVKRNYSGTTPNPFFRMGDVPFGHPRFPLYLVTRLAAYDVFTVKRMIDRALMAGNTGRFVLDLKADDDETGNDWLRNAAILIPDHRLTLDATNKVLYGQKDVIGYAAWGSNDRNRDRRWVGFQWLPGAIVTEFVSTNGRTFQRPPESWNIGKWTDDQRTWHVGAPQTLSADYLAEGATGASGHVNEPYLSTTPRPDLLFPAYMGGRNLAESFWLSIPVLSWQNIVLGDPLCSLGKPAGKWQ